jgi:periplasmic protein TonB
MKPVKIILYLGIALGLQGVLFLLLPLAHALFFDYPDRKQKHADVVYELETLVQKKPENKPQKTIRKIHTNLQIQAPQQSQNRSFQMDLSLAVSGDGSGDGVAVGVGGMANAVYEAGEVDEEAKVLQEFSPDYPKRARREGVNGYVKVYLIIDVHGMPTSVEVLQVEPPGYGFEKEAVNAIRQFRFKPAVLDQVPVSQKATKEFRFDIR